ncbi:MAG: zinc ribbon domain-containing protein [Oscillospiraceae bacterium]
MEFTMGIFEDFMAGAKNVVDFAEKKTDTMVELSKLKYQCGQLNSELRALYEKLGAAVYSMMQSEYDNKELVDSLSEEITEVKESLRAVNEKIAEKRELLLCPACGAKNDKEALYCMKCGNRLFPIDAQQETADEAPADESTSAEEPTDTEEK